MSITIVDRKSASEEFRTSLRKFRPGPELDLVESFLERVEIKVPRSCGITIFREPKIQSGFPDLVVVVWNKATAKRWNPLRVKLLTEDIRLMHFISYTGPCRTKDLHCVSLSKLNASLERLASADMIRCVRGEWTARPLSETFATKHIIAIEAKVSKWRSALNQAFLNTWFASTSCVLVPKMPRENRFLSEAQNLGIRVYIPEASVLDVHHLPPHQLPLSYASWLFNEWAWRASSIENRTVFERSDAKYSDMASSSISRPE
jgi:hypothetical protein